MQFRTVLRLAVSIVVVLATYIIVYGISGTSVAIWVLSYEQVYSTGVSLVVIGCESIKKSPATVTESLYEGSNKK